MEFTKMEGLGNDYIYLDCTKEVPEDLPELARRMSDRHFGIGGDGIICLMASQTADFGMAIYNADGSQAEMCGNGIRCLCKFAYDLGLTDKVDLKIETLAGVKAVHLLEKNGKILGATVDMGAPEIENPCFMEAEDQRYQGVPVSMGNPHVVCVAEDVKEIPLTAIGPILERHPRFPNRVNVEFAHVLSPTRIEMRVWERGSGETMACGTGACAVAVACAKLGLTRREVTVSLLGGELNIFWSEEDDHVYMTGPAQTVFTGEWQSNTKEV